MTARGFYTLFFGVVMLFTSLSVGSEAAFLLGVLALAALAYALLSVLLALFTLRVSQALPADGVPRGGSCRLSLTVRLLAPLPIAPAALSLLLPGGRTAELSAALRPFGVTRVDHAFACPHIGVYDARVRFLTLSDVFSLFCIRRRIKPPAVRVTVLPQNADTLPVASGTGEGEQAALHRALADHTTPSDLRAWQDGDELKRVHWKLSMRRSQLMVHTYETPMQPDCLLLLNTACGGRPPQDRLVIADILAETCMGIAASLVEQQRPARLPLPEGGELLVTDPASLEALRRSLAALAYDRTADFTRIITGALHRPRRCGSAVILSAELTPHIADAVLALAGVGIHVRFTLACTDRLSEDETGLLHLLLCSGVEAAHLSPSA